MAMEWLYHLNKIRTEWLSSKSVQTSIDHLGKINRSITLKVQRISGSYR